MIKKRIRTIYRSGISNIILFVTLWLIVLYLILSLIPPISAYLSGYQIGSLVIIVVLTAVGELLYLKVEEIDSNNNSKCLDQAGILSIYPSIGGQDFNEIISAPGKKIILNTWINNLVTITSNLERALTDSNSTLEINISTVNRPHAIMRGLELNLDSELAIKQNKEAISLFLSNLSNSQRSRVKVFSVNSSLKMTIFGDRKKAIVGQFWPGIPAEKGPQFLIETGTGFFYQKVWEYYERLEKIDITEEFSKLG